MRVIPTEWVRKAFDGLEREAREGLLTDKLRLVIPPDLGLELTEERRDLRDINGPSSRRLVSEWEPVDGD